MGRTVVAAVAVALAALIGGPGRAGTELVTLRSFNDDNGKNPLAGLIMDADGNLYGTTDVGGAGFGTVFELARSGSSYTLHSLAFFIGTNGSQTFGGVIMDAGGNLYGTTVVGGASNNGTVFELARSGSSYTLNTLASFNGVNGAIPVAGLIMDAGGNLYETTAAGGANGEGTVFELAKSGSSYTLNTLASFNLGANGRSPLGGLIMDGGGNLYGTTEFGGDSNDGTVFELAKNGSSYTLNTLVRFNGANGANPVGGLIMDAGGILYGTTGNGGAFGDGTVFAVVPEPSTWLMMSSGIAAVGALAWKRWGQRAAHS